MFKPIVTVAAFLFVVVSVPAQNADPVMVSLSIEVGKISRSVSLMSEKFGAYLDKVEKAPAGGSSALTERQ